MGTEHGWGGTLLGVKVPKPWGVRVHARGTRTLWKRMMVKAVAREDWVAVWACDGRSSLHKLSKPSQQHLDRMERGLRHRCSRFVSGRSSRCGYILFCHYCAENQALIICSCRLHHGDLFSVASNWMDLVKCEGSSCIILNYYIEIQWFNHSIGECLTSAEYWKAEIFRWSTTWPDSASLGWACEEAASLSWYSGALLRLLTPGNLYLLFQLICGVTFL